MMDREAQLTLEERIATLSALLEHTGWKEIVQPEIVRWQAAGMTELLSDVGDKKGQNDFLRGQIVAYKRVLQHFRAYLDELRDRLVEQTGGSPAPTDSAIPPAI